MFNLIGIFTIVTLLIPPIILFFKDRFAYIGVFSIYSMFLSIEPDILGNENNQTLANSSITPANIIPERYFPLLHPVPRAIPVKLIGAILIMAFFILLFYIRFMTKNLNHIIT